MDRFSLTEDEIDGGWNRDKLKYKNCSILKETVPTSEIKTDMIAYTVES